MRGMRGKWPWGGSESVHSCPRTLEQNEKTCWESEGSSKMMTPMMLATIDVGTHLSMYRTIASIRGVEHC